MNVGQRSAFVRPWFREMAYVSEQLGHANIQLTVKLYGHLQPGANRHWINNLPGAATTSSKSAGSVLI
jgi:hypothetical protein